MAALIGEVVAQEVEEGTNLVVEVEVEVEAIEEDTNLAVEVEVVEAVVVVMAVVAVEASRLLLRCTSEPVFTQHVSKSCTDHIKASCRYISGAR